MQDWRNNITWLEQVNHVLDVLAREAGVQKALQHLLEQINYYLAVDSILFTLSTEDGEVIEIAEAYIEKEKNIPEQRSLISFKSEKFTSPFLEGGTSYILNKSKSHDSELLQIRHLEYNSMLVLPLEERRTRPIHLVFMSLEENVFTSCDIPPCLSITRELRHILGALFYLPYSKAETITFERQRTSYELLRMCRGLTNTVQAIEKIAPLPITVLITGETGVGKELVAEAIHHLANKENTPFIKVNCGAIPENLIESILFGHEKGSFTGASESRIGYFEQANEGTLLLDEIGELPLSSQARLLRAIEYGEIQKVGSTYIHQVNVRVLASTHRNLEQMVKDKLFREDLYYRLSVFPINIPPLRERKMDIPILVSNFMKNLCKKLKIDNPPELSSEILTQLMRYNWKGNVRELEHKLEQALIMARIGTSTSKMSIDLPEFHQSQNLNNLLQQEPPLTLLELNKLYIEYILDKTGHILHGPMGAAKILNIHPNTLKSRMDLLGIALKSSRGRKKSQATE